MSFTKTVGKTSALKPQVRLTCASHFERLRISGSSKIAAFFCWCGKYEKPVKTRREEGICVVHFKKLFAQAVLWCLFILSHKYGVYTLTDPRRVLLADRGGKMSMWN